MKYPYFLIQLIFILSFGLISCGSDDGSAPTDKTFNARIQNSDNSYQEIQSTRQLYVSSHIMSGLRPVEADTSKVLASCKTNFRQDILSRETHLKKATKLPVKDILPSEVFSPTIDSNRKVVCDFEVEVYQAQELKVRINLDKINIINTHSFNNFDLSFLRNDQDTYIKLKDLEGQRAQLPSPEGEVEALCETNMSRGFFTSNEVNVFEAFSDYLFENKNLQACRLLVRSGLEEVWLSKSFFVQKAMPHLFFKIQENFSGEPEFFMDHHQSLQIDLVNRGTTPIFFKANLPKTNLFAFPIYSQGKKIFEFTPFQLAARWEVHGAVGTGPLQKGKSRYFTLNPGQQATIALVSRGQSHCRSLHPSPEPGPVCNPKIALILQGYRYHMQHFPKIEISTFDDPTLEQWKPISLTPNHSPKIGKDFIFWKGYQGRVNNCSETQKLEPEPRKYPTFKQLGVKFQCR